MKRRKEWVKVKEAKARSKIVVGAKLALTLLALAILGVCAAAQEDTADYWYNKSGELYVNGSYNPEYAEAWLHKAETLRSMNRLEEAVIAYYKAIELQPENEEDSWIVWENEARILMQLGKYNESLEAYDEAIKAFDEVIEIDPNFGGWYGMAQALKALGRYNESITAFDKSLEQFSGNPLVWVDKGEALQALGRNEEAVKAYDKAIETAGSSPSFIDEGGFDSVIIEEAFEIRG